MISVRLFIVLLIGIFTLSCKGTVSIPHTSSVAVGSAGSVGSPIDERLTSGLIRTATKVDEDIDRQRQAESCDNANIVAAGLAVEHKSESIVQTPVVSSPATERSVFSRYDPVTKKRVLTYYGLMLAGAVARSASATAGMYYTHITVLKTACRHRVYTETNSLSKLILASEGGGKGLAVRLRMKKNSKRSEQ
jgi:hypothetical protein